MPATNEKYTLNIEPVGDHLEVTIPELGVTVQTTGTSRDEAVEAGQRAIIAYLMSKKRTRQRKPGPRQAQAS